MDAAPDHKTELPGPTITPLLSALGTGVMFITSIYSPWGIPLGAVLLVAALIAWFWPRKPHREELLMEGPS
jgi:hypothetical protein